MQTHRHIRSADHIAPGNGDMLFSIPIIFECHNMEISKAGWQFRHRYNADTNFIPAQPFTFMIAFCFKKHIEFFMHSRCHIHLTS